MSFFIGCLLFLDGAFAVIILLLFLFLHLDTLAIVMAIIIAIPIWIWLLIKRVRKNKKEQIRKNTPCLFNDGISENEFQQLAHREAKRIKRLHIEVFGPIVNCTVDSQSGISTWKFVLDFNDYGHITGSWWMTRRDNNDSSIPNRYAALMHEAIVNRLEERIHNS